MAGHLQINLLGTPELQIDGATSPRFTLRKSQALLYYLSITQGAQPRTLLANLLWSECTEENARAGLRKVLADLRSQVEDHLVIRRDTVAFNHASPYLLDVELFEQPLTHLRMNPLWTTTPEAVAAITTAVGLYRGEFLAGFRVHRAPVFEEWVTLQRERLRLDALQMLSTLARIYLSQGDYSRAITYSEQLLDLEPYDEETLCLLMRALVLNNQPAAAEQRFQSFSRRMRQELGLPMHEDTIALYQHIRRSFAGNALANRAPPPLLPSPPPLLGRQRELTELLDTLLEPDCRLLTIVGAEGMGKTRLAQEIGTIFAAGHVRQESFLVSLRHLRTRVVFVPAVARAVGLRLVAGQNPCDQLLTYLRPRQALLILDGCEGLLNGRISHRGQLEAMIGEIMTSAPYVKILATSRRQLGVAGEHLFRLQGLHFPPHTTAESHRLPGYGGVALFLWQMRQLQPDIQPGVEDLQAIAHLCRLVQGSPLEILLLARWTESLSPTEIVKQLAEVTV